MHFVSQLGFLAVAATKSRERAMIFIAQRYISAQAKIEMNATDHPFYLSKDDTDSEALGISLPIEREKSANLNIGNLQDGYRWYGSSLTDHKIQQ
jgi:hypothetical protein